MDTLRRENMSPFKSKMLITLIFMFVAGSIAPTNAVGHSPGVSVGYWAKYGNFQAKGLYYDSSGYNETEWLKVEVIGVNGTEVTMSVSRMLKNGSEQEVSTDIVSDVETGYIYGPLPDFYYFVIATNLGQNESLPGNKGVVIETESRSHFGMNRTVAIVRFIESGDPSEQRYEVYDQLSGLLLEMNQSIVSESYPVGNSSISFEAIALNLVPNSLDVLVYVIVGIVVVVLVVSVLVLRQVRKSAPRTHAKHAESRNTEKTSLVRVDQHNHIECVAHIPICYT